MDALPDLHWTPPRAAYLPGEKIERAVFGLDGELVGRFAFTIHASPGSGFAGQVYRAVAHPGTPGLPPVVALKVLRPRSAAKLWLRDTLFRICFQTSFSARLRVEALRSGLLWQAFLHAALSANGEMNGAVALPYGYYWDPDLASYTEIHEWVDGRAARSEADDQLLARLLRRTSPPAGNEMARKKAFMDTLANLCREIGAPGLARQFAWWTLVSQANVLTPVSAAWPDEIVPESMCAHTLSNSFVAVDCRPGLAVPFFLPLSPAHAQIIWDGLRRGVLVHYNEIELPRLAAYLADHPEVTRSIGSSTSDLVRRNFRVAADFLASEEAAARAALPDLWQTHARFFTDPAFRLHLRRAAAADWLRLQQIDEHSAATLPEHPLAFYLLAFAGLLPFSGSFLARFLGSAPFRDHCASLLLSPAYRRAAYAAWIRQTLPAWQVEQRVNPAHMEFLQRSPPAFLSEAVLLAWLPAGFHRALMDPAVLRQRLARFWRNSLQLLLSQEHRLDWIGGILRAQAERGMLSPAQLAIHLDQLHEPRMQSYIRDLGFASGLDLFSRLVYLALGLYGIGSGDFLPLGIALVFPIPPSGPLRVLYLLASFPADLRGARQAGQSLPRAIQARLLALFIAPWRWVGNLFPLVEISAFYTRIAFLLAEHFIARAAAVIPVFGGEGRLLQHAIFQLCYNLPLSLRRELKKVKG